MNFLKLILENKLNDDLLSGNFGLEKENLRVDHNGVLALTRHPEVLGDKALNPYITTDFGEAQPELVTPVSPSIKQALDNLELLHDLVSVKLTDEFLWPYSLPSILPIDDSLIKTAKFNVESVTQYREYLAKKYGKRKQLLSGVHFNFSFSDAFIDKLYLASGASSSIKEFRNEVYLKVSRFYLRYSWLVIYLFGGTPLAHESYLCCCGRSMQKITPDSYAFDDSGSFRNGISGYRNLVDFYVSYNSLTSYVNDIDNAINQGKIIAPQEYYSQIRLKGHSKSGVLDDLLTNGINYVEVRSLDLNPLYKIGIDPHSLEFIHLLLVYGLIAPDVPLDDLEYQVILQNQILAADGSRDSVIDLYSASTNSELNLLNWGSELIATIKRELLALGISQDKLISLDVMQNKLAKPQFYLAELITKQVIEHGYTKFFMDKAFDYNEQSLLKLSQLVKPDEWDLPIVELFEILQTRV